MSKKLLLAFFILAEIAGGLAAVVLWFAVRMTLTGRLEKDGVEIPFSTAFSLATLFTTLAIAADFGRRWVDQPD